MFSLVVLLISVFVRCLVFVLYVLLSVSLLNVSSQDFERFLLDS